MSGNRRGKPGIYVKSDPPDGIARRPKEDSADIERIVIRNDRSQDRRNMCKFHYEVYADIRIQALNGEDNIHPQWFARC